MRILQFQINGQKLSKDGDFSELIAGTKGYLYAAYEYDGNIFRTHSLTAEQIKADPESYTDYEGDDAPTDAMVEYANLKIDEYTAQLMEEGLI